MDALKEKYTSQRMINVWDKTTKHKKWRKIWVALAKAQRDTGLSITDDQIKDLERNSSNIPYESIKKYEEKFKHEVVAHIHAYGDQAKAAKPIIHLGATSSDITDNAEILIIKDALAIVLQHVASTLNSLLNKAGEFSGLECVAYTHYQPAKPYILGMRFMIYANELNRIMDKIEETFFNIPCKGMKGAVGTQHSFVHLYGGDLDKIRRMEEIFAQHLGMESIMDLTTQTYSRLYDIEWTHPLHLLVCLLHKIASDFRMMAHDGILIETVNKSQMGSSAMPHKTNPIYSERICGISRYTKNLFPNLSDNMMNQWFERSLDDSSNRRLSLYNIFASTDAVARLANFVISNCAINEKATKSQYNKYKANLYSETIINEAVKNGMDRQDIHNYVKNYYNDGGSINMLCNILNISVDDIENESKPFYLQSAISDYISKLRPKLVKYELNEATINR